MNRPPRTKSPALNEHDTLRAIYDRSYHRFWEADLGRRCDREIDLITSLGTLDGSKRVLDLACAFGRISNALAARGHQLHGVDSSEPLLAIARARAEQMGLDVSYEFGDLLTVPLPSAFDVALLWSTSLGHLGEERDQLILERAIESLASGGRLLIESRHWDSMKRDFETVTVRHVDSDFLIEEHEYDPLTGIQWTDQTLITSDGVSRKRYGIRRYSVPELRWRCLEAGFSRVLAFNEDGAPLRVDSRRCVIVATR